MSPQKNVKQEKLPINGFHFYNFYGRAYKLMFLFSKCHKTHEHVFLKFGKWSDLSHKLTQL